MSEDTMTDHFRMGRTAYVATIATTAILATLSIASGPSIGRIAWTLPACAAAYALASVARLRDVDVGPEWAVPPMCTIVGALSAAAGLWLTTRGSHPMEMSYVRAADVPTLVHLVAAISLGIGGLVAAVTARTSWRALGHLLAPRAESHATTHRQVWTTYDPDGTGRPIPGGIGPWPFLAMTLIGIEILQIATPGIEDAGGIAAVWLGVVAVLAPLSLRRLRDAGRHPAWALPVFGPPAVVSALAAASPLWAATQSTAVDMSAVVAPIGWEPSGSASGTGIMVVLVAMLAMAGLAATGAIHMLMPGLRWRRWEEVRFEDEGATTL